MALQLYAWVFAPSYNQSNSVEFLSIGDNEPYTIPTVDFLPVFSIISNYTDETGAYPEYWDFNNPNYFAYSFFQYDERNETPVTVIDGIPCLDFIKQNTDFTEQEIVQFKRELVIADAMICPNTTSF